MEVDDIYVMSYLLAKGYKAGERNKRSGRVSVEFSGAGVADAISEYFSGGVLPAKDYVKCYTEARELVFYDKERN